MAASKTLSGWAVSSLSIKLRRLISSAQSLDMTSSFSWSFGSL